MGFVVGSFVRITSKPIPNEERRLLRSRSGTIRLPDRLLQLSERRRRPKRKRRERNVKGRQERRPKLRQRKLWKLVLQERRPSVRHELQEKRKKRKNVKDWKEKRKRREGRRNWKPLKSSRRTSKNKLRSTRRKSRRRKSLSMRRTRCGMPRSTILKKNVKKLNDYETKSWRRLQRKKPSSQRSLNYPIKRRRSSRIAQKSLHTFVRTTRRCGPRRLSTVRIMTPCKKIISDCWKLMHMLVHLSRQ